MNAAFARAVERAVERYADPKTLRRGKRRWRCNAWWRGGRDANVSVDIATGFWTDWATGEEGGAKELAEKIGQSMRDFMEGLESEQRAAPPPPVEREGIADLWEALQESNRTLALTEARDWLISRRFPPDVDFALDSGFATLNARNAVVVDDALGFRWAAERVAAHGAHVVAPVRDAGSGVVCNLQFRPLSPGAAAGDSRRWVPGCFLGPPSTPYPRGYGFAGGVRRARQIVLLEGFADTAVAELALRRVEGAVAVGAVSASCVGHWIAVLSTVADDVDVVVVPQRDPPSTDPKKPGEQSQTAFAALVAALRRLGTRARFFEWDRFLDATGVTGRGIATKDVADVLRALGPATLDLFRDAVRSP